MGKHLDKSLAVDNPLGSMQPIWDAWTPVEDQVKNYTTHQFVKLVCIQLDEIREHYNHGNLVGVTNEIVDIIAVCLNWFRQMGCNTPEEVDAIIRDRCASRYDGQVQDIMDKYRHNYGL